MDGPLRTHRICSLLTLLLALMPAVAQTHETNSMVEEMMLLANVSVAQAIVNRFPSCSLLRRHQTPGVCVWGGVQMVWRGGATALFAAGEGSAAAGCSIPVGYTP